MLFTSPACAVCESLRPKIQKLLKNRFPRLSLQIVDCDRESDKALRFGVRTVPTVVVRFGGQESTRRERVFSLEQLAEDIERPYRIYFEV